MIECVKLSKRFGQQMAVDQVSLSVAKGQAIGIVGESGCGKSTLAKMMAGLMKPDGGMIKTQGSVQMVFQDPYMSFDPLWTVGNSLRMALRELRLTPQQQQHQLEAILTEVGIGLDVLGRYPHEFSGGQRQRLALARCLLAKAEVLILDEVTSNLDVLIAYQLIELLKQLRKEHQLSIIFITHHLTQALKLVDTMMIMKQATIVETLTASTFMTGAKHPYTRLLAGTMSSCLV